MTQWINLYQPELLEPRAPRSTRLLLLALVLTLVLLLSYVLWGAAQTRSLQGDLRALETKRTEVAAALALLQQSPAPQKSPLLQREVERLEAEVEAKRPLLERFKESRMTTAGPGFSAELQGLARRTPEGLWLRHLVLAKDGGRTALEGSALRAELVPQLLQNMNAETVFSGIDFSGFRLLQSAADDGPVEFVVETEREPKR